MLLSVLTILVMTALPTAAQVNADFAAPGILCINEHAEIDNNSTNAIRYEWDFCEGDFSNPPTASIIGSLSGAFNPKEMDIVADGLGNWFAFVTSRSTGSIYRFFFEGSLAATPVITNLGNPGLLLNGPEQIKIVSENQSWYALVVNGTNSTVVRLTFGSSLNSSPSAQQIASGISTFNSGMDVAWDGSAIVAVITNSTMNTLSIVNFGNSITNNPQPADILTTSAIADGVALDDLELVKVGDVWYGFLVAFNSRTIHRLKFGSSLFALPQSVTITGPVFSADQRPSGINFAYDAGSAFLFVQTFVGDIFKLDLGVNIENNAPAISPVGDIGVLQNSVNLELVKANSRWFGFVIDQTDLTVGRFTFQENCPVVATSVDAAPTVTYASQGQYIVGLTAFDSNGTSDYKVQQITVENKIAPQIEIQSENICAQSPVKFSVTSDSPLTSYQWDFGDSSTPATISEPDHLYSAAGEVQVALKVEATNSCSNRIVKNLKLYDQPVADFSIPSTLICTNNEITIDNLTIDNYEGNLSHQWFVNNQAVTSGFDLVTSFSSTGSKSIKLAVSIPGCENEKVENTSFVEAGPVVDFYSVGNCSNTILQFQNSITETIQVYSWDFGDGSTSSAPNPTHTFTLPGTYDVRLQASTANGCQNSTVKMLTIDPTPSPDFSVDGPPSTCTGSVSHFFDLTPTLVGSQIESWAWKFGDLAASAADKNPSYIFTTAGTYNVELSVTSDAGCSNSVIKPIIILQAPSVDFLNGPTCANSPVNFTGSSDKAAVFYWEIGASYYEVKNITHTFNTVGNHPVKLTVVDENGCTAQVKKDLVVPQPIVPTFTVTNNCKGFQANFSSTSVGSDAVSSYLWNFAGEGTSTNPNPTFTFTSTGGKLVTLQVTTVSGCVYQKQNTIQVIQAPQPNFSFSPGFGVPPQEISFTNESTNASIFAWNFGDGNTSTEQSPKHTFTSLGDFNVELRASNNAGCETSFAKTISMVAPLPDVDLNLMTLSTNADGTLRVIITIANKGNTFLRNLPVRLDVSGEVTLETLVTETIAPFSQYNLVLNYGIDATKNLEFLCASTTLDGDLNPEGNRICNQLNPGVAILAPYPNPATNVLTVEWVAQEGELVNVKLVDTNGKNAIDFTEVSSAGLNQKMLDISRLRSGVYILRINTSTHSKTHRILVSGQN